jgi:hypothetical protein
VAPILPELATGVMIASYKPTSGYGSSLNAHIRDYALVDAGYWEKRMEDHPSGRTF